MRYNRRMVIDNRKLIRNILTFPEYKDGRVLDEKHSAQEAARNAAPRNNDVDSRDAFYTVQLIQRAKDNPKALYSSKNFRNNSNRTLQQFQIYSLADFDVKTPLIVELAKIYQARAYIELNLKDSKDVFARMMSNMSDRFKTGNYTKLHRLYNEAVGETPAAAHTRKTWLVDVDDKDIDRVDRICSFVERLRGGGAGGSGEVYAVVPTKNGFHIITSSFEYDRFAKHPDCAGVDVHKRNPTILWMETDWSAKNAS